MSSNDSLNDLGQEVINEYSPSLTNSYFVLSIAVIMVYDYFLTFSLEVSHIWNGRPTIMKALFVLNRYAGIAFMSFNVISNFVDPASDTECRALNYTVSILVVLLAFAISCIFTLRTFAIYGRSWIVFLLLAIPGSAIVMSDIWAAVVDITFAFPRQLQIGPSACYSRSSSSSNSSELVSFVSGAVFDVLVLILTVYRTSQIITQSYLKKADTRRNLIFILQRDGIFYYATIFVPILVIIALHARILATYNVKIDLVSEDFTLISDALKIVLVNRLVLNLSLSHTTQARENSEFRRQTDIDTHAFSTNLYLGDIGGPVCTVQDDLYDNQFEFVPVTTSAEEIPKETIDLESPQSPQYVFMIH